MRRFPVEAITFSLFVAALAGCGVTDPGQPDVAGVSVQAATNSIGIGASLQLSAMVTPSGANSAVTWSSSDDTRVAVSSTGLASAAVLPITSTTVTITATSVEDPTISGSLELTIVCGPLASSAVSNGGTLPADTCYSVETALSVTGGTLVIEPGVEISFGTAGSLSIGSGGRLNAVGTAGNGIVFTSIDPVGSWRGIRFDDSQSADNVLHYVTIENAGSSGWSGASYSASALLLEGTSVVDIQNSTIRGSASRGITLYENAAMTFLGNTLEDNAVPAWLHPNTVHYLDTNSTYVGNSDDVVRVGFGNADRVSTTQTWPAVGVPLELQDRMFIEAHLTLDPGVHLEALTGVGLIVRNQGAITAQGTANDSIVFSSSEDLRGAWKGLQIQTQSSSNVFSHVIFENGGSDPWTGGSESRAMVYLDAASSAVFENTTFRGSAQYALWVLAGSDITGFDANTFSDNARTMIVHPDRVGAIAGNTQFLANDEQFVRVTFGNNDAVQATQTWDALAVPYRVMDRTFVRAPLTIEAGAVLEFAQNAHLILRDSGTLTAVGTAVDRITFRGADNLSAYWKGIEFATLSAMNRIEYADLSNAGSADWFGGSNNVGTLYVTADGSAALDNVTFASTGGYAAVIAWEGVLTCTNTDDGGFQYYVYEPGNDRAQSTCPS